MGVVLPIGQINKIKSSSVVLVGGCFDILHVGHITFLSKAKKEGDTLVVLLESDQSIKETKGLNRPINTQKDRAKILGALTVVDYIVLLPKLTNDGYDQIVKKIKPRVIASTRGDLNIHHKKRAAALSGAKLKMVTSPIKDRSTTNLIKLLASNS